MLVENYRILGQLSVCQLRHVSIKLVVGIQYMGYVEC